jgi:hypothetical protein
MRDVAAIVVYTEQPELDEKIRFSSLLFTRYVKFQAADGTVFPNSARIPSGTACSLRKRNVPCSRRCSCRPSECANSRSTTRSSGVRKGLCLVQGGSFVCLLPTSGESALVQSTHLPSLKCLFRSVFISGIRQEVRRVYKCISPGCI